MQRLSELEEGYSMYQATWRHGALRRVHRSTTERFIESSGFGEGRMRYITEARLRIEEPRKIPLQEPYCPEPQNSAELDRLAVVIQPSEKVVADSLWGTHSESVLDFVNPEGFGYIKDRDHVAGFQLHHFSGIPSIPTKDAKWLLVRLELVSLLKHEKPMVYLSEYLPKMDELSETAVREPSLFESDSIHKLYSGEDLIVEAANARISMVGSLRAGKQCLECHQAKRGTLLGAFSYEFQRAPHKPVVLTDGEAAPASSDE